MPRLYLTEQGSCLRKSGDRLIVDKEGEKLLEVQCHKIEAVLIFGNVQFTTQAVQEMFQHGIEMALFTSTGRLIGQLTSPNTKNIALRIEQFRRYESPIFRLDLGKRIVEAKIRSGLSLIRLFSYNHPEVDFEAEKNGLDEVLAGLPQAKDLAELMGREGLAARVYFGACGKMVLAEGIEFWGRAKRPPTDPFNALLSLGYTIVANEIASLLDGLGFDPYLGYLHDVQYGRPSLAADLLEEFRTPAVERLTLQLVNNRVLRPEHFTHTPEEGVRLERVAFKQYIEEYERYMNQEFVRGEEGRTTLRKTVRDQAERLAASIAESVEYRPFVLEA